MSIFLFFFVFFLRWCGGVLLVGVVLACCLMFLVVTWAGRVCWFCIREGGVGGFTCRCCWESKNGGRMDFRVVYIYKWRNKLRL